MSHPKTQYREWLVNDLVISEENCNLSCSYCLTDASQFKDKHLDHPLRQPPVVLTYEDTLQEQLDAITDRTLTQFDIPILKVSGGEVMLIRKVMDFLRKEAKKYNVLQILTNGLMLDNKTLQEFQSWGNVVLQISIDHHTVEGNAHRITVKSLQEKLLNKIDLVTKYNIPLELYCVLNDTNTGILDQFLDFLLPYSGKLMVFPFPVRGPIKELFYPKPEQHVVLERILTGYTKYSGVLPPKPYMERLLSFLKQGKRTFGCSLPRMVFGTFNDGTVTPCPNIWFKNLGNVLSPNYKDALIQVEKSPFYHLLVVDSPRLDACKACFTPWDILGLYIEDLITLDELCESPMYRHPDLRGRLYELKRKIKEEPLELGSVVEVK